RGDECARSLTPGHQARMQQPIERLAHRYARDLVGLGQFALRRQGFVGRENVALDRRAKDALQLQVKGRPTPAVQFSHALDEHHSSFCRAYFEALLSPFQYQSVIKITLASLLVLQLVSIWKLMHCCMPRAPHVAEPEPARAGSYIGPL